MVSDHATRQAVSVYSEPVKRMTELGVRHKVRTCRALSCDLAVNGSSQASVIESLLLGEC